MSHPVNSIPIHGTAPVPPPSFYDREREEALFRRYNRKEPPALVFEFTRRKDFLHQYYKLRAKEYISVHGLTHFPDTETEYDRSGHIMVIRMGNFCVGGIRLDIKTPRKPKLLPMETDDFRLEKHFPQLHHNQMSYCQASGFALLEEFHGGEISRQIISRILHKAAALNMKMLFAASPILNSRLYKQNCAVMGWKEPKIHYDIALPDDPSTEGIKLYLFSVVMEKSAVQNSEKNRPYAGSERTSLEIRAEREISYLNITPTGTKSNRSLLIEDLVFSQAAESLAYYI